MASRSQYVSKTLHCSNVQHHYRPHPKDDGRLCFQSVHHCGGYPGQGPDGGYPSQVQVQMLGTPARSRSRRGGVPQPGPGPDGGYPNQVQMGRYPGHVQMGHTPARDGVLLIWTWTWDGAPPVWTWTWEGVPPCLDLGWGTPSPS